MSKWALWAAHRYLHPGAAEPRLVGADGRTLQKPWRQRSPAALEVAQRVRATRPRPWWPRLVGFALLAVAGIYAFDPVGAWEGDVGARRRAETGPRSGRPEAVAPRGVVGADAATRFRFAPGEAAGPFTLVLLDAAYAELLRRPCPDGVACSLDSAQANMLETGRIYHWYVLGDHAGKPVASTVAAFEIR